MKILKEIIDTKKISVLANPIYLCSLTDAIDYGYLENNGCYLGFVVKKKYGLWKIIQFPGPITGNVESMTSEDRKKYYDSAISILQEKYNADEYANINTFPTDFFPSSSYFCKFGSYILDLAQSEENLFKGLHSKHRNVIKKADKDGLTVDFGPEYMEDCARIMDDTFHRQNKLSNSINGLRILSKLREQCEFWVVKLDNEIQGCAILLWDKNSSYYMHGGSIAHIHSGAMNFLHWKAILKMKERGVKKYDFVGARVNFDPGSKLEGIQRFKSRFGGPMKVGYLWRYDVHPLKMKLYRFLLKSYFYLHRDFTPKDIITEERNKGNY